MKIFWSNLNQSWGSGTFLSPYAAVSSTGFSSPSITRECVGYEIPWNLIRKMHQSYKVNYFYQLSHRIRPRYFIICHLQVQKFDNAPRVKWSQIILISLCFSILPHKTADQTFLLFFVKNVWSNLNQFWGLETFLSAHAAVSSTGFSSPSISGNWKSGLWPLRHLFVSSWLRILKSKKRTRK